VLDSKSARIVTAIAVSRLVVDLVRVVHESDYLHRHFGAVLEEIFVGFCVHIGTIEERPMSATKISSYIGVPRTNVSRALRELVHRGAIYKVGFNYLTNLDRLAERAKPAAIRKMIKVINHTTDVINALEKSIPIRN
jgi:hypothetical protein